MSDAYPEAYEIGLKPTRAQMMAPLMSLVAVAAVFGYLSWGTYSTKTQPAGVLLSCSGTAGVFFVQADDVIRRGIVSPVKGRLTVSGGATSSFSEEVDVSSIAEGAEKLAFPSGSMGLRLHFKQRCEDLAGAPAILEMELKGLPVSDLLR